VSELLGCWRRQAGNREAMHLWRVIPLCLMWCLWHERNARSFNDQEIGLLELKRWILQTLFTRRVAWNTTRASTFAEFLDLCFFLFKIGVLLYTSHVLGLCSSVL
jgi:hypothetical protein